MKHDKPKNSPEWNPERIQRQIDGVKARIKLMQAEYKVCLGVEADMRSKRAAINTKISNAHIYINQLQAQLTTQP